MFGLRNRNWYLPQHYLAYYALHLSQIEYEDPVLLSRFIDRIRGSSLYVIGYSFASQEFYGFFVPGRWDKIRGRKKQRIVFNEEGLQNNYMKFDDSFIKCRFSQLEKGL